MLQKRLPAQINSAESETLKVMFIITASMAYFLVVEQIEKSTHKVHVNFMIKNIVPLMVMCHVICVSANMPGAVK